MLVMISPWLLGGLSGVLFTSLSMVDVSSTPLVVGVCTSSFPTLLVDCGVATNTAGFSCGVQCYLSKFGVTADCLI